MMRSRRRNRRTKLENDSRVTSKTRRCIIEEDSVPPDLVIEILKRLPLKSVARFLLVSKLWSTIIRSQDFIRSFSSMQPQTIPLLFVVNGLDKQSGLYKWFFYSSSSSILVEEEEEEPFALSLSLIRRTNCIIPKRRFCDVHYVNGLISHGYGQQQTITNPSTGKSITLPDVKSRNKIIHSFFGYDQIDCQYKVLCMSERGNVPSSEHQVFTLGGRGVEQSWRMIECITPHCSKTNSKCINGVLYYGALTGTDMMDWCLMKFNVRTEKLDLLSRLNVSFDPEHDSQCLINYQGKVTLAFETSIYEYDLWVMMDQDAEIWSKICVSINPWWHLLGDTSLSIVGTIHSGEIVFVTGSCHQRFDVTYVVYYDHKKNRLRRIKVENIVVGNQFPQFFEVELFFDYVESAMLL